MANTTDTLAQQAAGFLDESPAPIGLPPDLLANAESALAAAAQASTACADACLAEADTALSRCIRRNLDAADLASATARVLGRQLAYQADITRAALNASVLALDACATECESHGDMHDHCARCAATCHRASDACRSLLQELTAPYDRMHDDTDRS